MGNYLNPGNEAFCQAIRSEIYVDKTGLINFTNRVLGTEGKCIALSHARRFGKSQAAGMIDAYYSRGCDSRGIFEGFEIAQTPEWDRYLNQFHVVHLDMATLVNTYQFDLVNSIKKRLLDEIVKETPAIGEIIDFSYGLPEIFDHAAKITGSQFVIIIDEWDAVIRNYADQKAFVHEYMQFLHDIFKSEASRRFLALGYITGILPIKKIADESALNNFREYTMLNSKQITKYYGFTEKEVKGLCRKYRMDLDSVKAWYDGYLINGMHIYNPNSVVQSMEDEMCDSYWKNTASFETIQNYILLNFDGLKDDVLRMIAKEKIKVDVTTFQNDLSVIRSRDEALTALIHLGYLAYDSRRREAFIPNYEVLTAFQAALKTGKWREIAKLVSRSEDLLFDTIDGRTEKVAETLDLAHEAYASIIQYNNENALSCVLTMAYASAQAYYNIEREFPSGKGFADLTFLPRHDAPDMPAFVVELKYNKSADSAIEQIKERRYAGKLSGYADQILLVGINYNKETKKHACVIESHKADRIPGE